MAVVGGVTLQALLTEPTPAYVVLWAAAQKAGAFAAVRRGRGATCSSIALAVAVFDLVTAVLAAMLWHRLRVGRAPLRGGALVRRSLVLAGGGMRVAWQTGVVAALTEHGLGFHHIDGTSGGIMTAGMLLSGQRPAEMAAALVRPRRAGLQLAAAGARLPEGAVGAARDGRRGRGIRTVFPHLGIDVDKIRASTVEGTFNLVDFVTKCCVAVPHTEVDAELLAAGMSLPIAMPPCGAATTSGPTPCGSRTPTSPRRCGAVPTRSGWCGASATPPAGATGRWSSTST